jgi:glycosyltransferase involved in cell wall biosynthesis
VPPDDPHALADALEHLAGDPTLRREPGEVPRAAMRRYDPGAIASRWEELFGVAPSRPDPTVLPVRG